MATINPSTESGAAAVGIVSAIFGTVKAIASNGAERILHLGDRVYASELIATSDLSGITVEFRNGGRIDLGRSSEAMLDSDVYGPTDVDRADLASSIEAAQQAILAGADPTAILAAPAAGGGGGEDLSSSLSPPPIVERVGLQVTPESGFDTEGLSQSITPDLPQRTGFLAQQAAAVDGASTTITAVSDDTNSPNDFITYDNTLVISGTAAAGASVDVFLNGISIGVATADTAGGWTLDYTGTTLADGDYQLSATGTSAAGVSSASQPLTVFNDPPVAVDDLVLSNIVDGSAIPIPALALMANDSDPDADPLSLVSTQNPQLGSVTSNAAMVEFVPEPGEVFSANATKMTETSASNNDNMLTAVEFKRSAFGKPEAGDINSITLQDGSLNSVLFSGKIIDTSIRDQDWIKLDLRAGEKLILDIDNGDDGDRDVGTDDNDVDMYLELFDSSGTRLDGNDDAPADTQQAGGAGSVMSGYHSLSLDSYLQYDVPQDGTYFVKASAWDNSAVGVSSDDGVYDLWISIGNPQFENPAFDYTIEDGRSGSDSATASITLFDSDIVSGSSANEILVGRDGNGSLLQGHGGDDTLLGGSGADSLQGGAGSDLLVGGAGDDIYIFKVGEDGSDEIQGYQPGADVLDISDLLTGIDVTGNLESYVQVNSGGELRLDLTGSGDFSGNTIAHLDGVSSGTSVTLLVDAGPLELLV